MKTLDPLAFIVAHSLEAPRAPVPVKTHPVPRILTQNSAVGCPPAFRLVESAFPIVTMPGFSEMLRTLLSEQGDQELRSVQPDRDWNYTIVPWED